MKKSNPRRTRTVAFAALVTCSAMLLSACSLLSGESETPPASEAAPEEAGFVFPVNPELQAMLPEELRNGGEITVAVAASSPPAAFVDEKTGEIIGLQPDLVGAWSSLLGIQANIENVDYPTILPGLEAGRFDLGLQVGDFVERQATVDFIDNYSGGWTILVPAKNPNGISGTDGLCGYTVGALGGGTSHEKRLVGFSDACVANGEEPIAIELFPDSKAFLLALQSGRVDAVTHDYAAAAYMALVEPERYMTLDPELSAPNAMAFPKQSTELRDAIFAAIEWLYEEGVYREIYEKWGLADVMLTPAINGSTHSLG